jgi:hypothetical protein
MSDVTITYVIKNNGQKINFGRLVSMISLYIKANQENNFYKLISEIEPISVRKISQKARKKALENLPKGHLKSTFRMFLFPF